MFRKKPQIKNLAPLRSSDRRKLTDQIISEYQIPLPETEDVPAKEAEDPQPSSLTALRNSLLPEGTLWAKFSTSTGQDVITSNGTIYVGTDSVGEQRVLWLRVEEKILPSVYTLWRHPRILPLLHTPEIVLQKMRGGADLMTPGLAMGPPFPSGATKGAIVAIAGCGRPSIPLVVGTCEIDVAALKKVQGAKGHAVRGMHWHGDEIWAWSHDNKPGKDPPDHIQGWLPDVGDSIESGAALENLSLGGDAGDATANNEPDPQEPVPADHESSSAFESVEKEWSTKEIDDAFRNAFLYAIQTARNKVKDDPAHGISFPIAQSQFMSTYVLPYLPIFGPTDAAALQLKKTSWKNIKKFIKALEKELLLKSKDRNGGETVVLDIDFDDSSVVDFEPYKLPKKAASQKGNVTSQDPATSSGDDSVGQELQRIILLRPKEKLSPIFAPSAADPRELYSTAELRPIVTAYIESENLVVASNKRLITLNPILIDSLFGQSTADQEAVAKGKITREALFERVNAACSPHWAILRNRETREDVKLKAGTPPTINIVLETRSGNKTATRVSGVEPFHMVPSALAEELQKTCASSTSVSQLAGSSPKTPVMDIMVQGPQKEAVIKALQRRGVAKDWVVVTDRTKGKKR